MCGFLSLHHTSKGYISLCKKEGTWEVEKKEFWVVLKNFKKKKKLKPMIEKGEVFIVFHSFFG